MGGWGCLGGWVGKIEDKVHLSSAEAEIGAELGKKLRTDRREASVPDTKKVSLGQKMWLTFYCVRKTFPW